MYEHILVATDGSDNATTAARHAVELAARYTATLHALYVVETRTGYDETVLDLDEIREHLRELGEESLTEIEHLADERDVQVVSTIETGVPSECILAYIDGNDVDFVFMGERGRSEFKTILLGSTTEAVLHETDVPVALV